MNQPLTEVSVQEFHSFVAAFERQSYADAARALGLAVPTVWGHVRHLEQQYGRPLFGRVGRGVVPTDAGRRLYAHAQRILIELRSSVEAVREDESPTPKTFTVLTGVRMTFEDFGPVLKEYHARWPQVTLRLLHGDNRKAEPFLLNSEADLALAIDPGPGLRSDDIHAERAYRLDHLAAVPKGHPLAKVKQLRLCDLLAHPLVLGTPHTYSRMLFDQAVHRENLAGALRVVAETDNSAYTFACVRAGLGVGVVAGRADGELGRGLVLLPLENLLGPAWVVFLWRRGKELAAHEDAFVRVVREQLGSPSERESA